MWQVVFKKEFKEIFSDSRTRFNVIVSPLLITPLILALVGSMAQRQAKESRAETIKVGVVGMQSAPRLMDELKGANKIELEPVESVEAAEAKVRDRSHGGVDEDGVVPVPAGQGAAVDEGDVRIAVGQQGVGKGQAGGTGTDDEVVGQQGRHANSRQQERRC